MVFKIYPFVMCGGAGTRLWPMSTKSQPKQFHKIVSDLSMLQETAIRCGASQDLEVAPPSFVCASAHKDLVVEQCTEIGLIPHKIILEPMAKNTAAVAATIGLAMTRAKTDEGALVLLLPADHYIGDVQAFWEYIKSGCRSALAGNIVTFGIQPTHPETGYGYIQAGDSLGDESLSIVEFVEKPDLETAKAYIENGSYFWNAGIFLFQPSAISEAFRSHAPGIIADANEALSQAKTEDNIIYLDGLSFDKCRSESFDFAIMEKASNISLVGPVDIGWNDIGSWRAVWEHEINMGGPAVEEGYCSDTHTCKICASDVLIRSSGPFVATVGVSNLAVIATAESVLVIDLNSAQRVKEVVAQLDAAKIDKLI